MSAGHKQVKKYNMLKYKQTSNETNNRIKRGKIWSPFEIGNLTLDFYAPGSNDRGHIVFVLSVCLPVVNFNLRYNF